MPITLETPRLLLRPYTPDDAEEAYRIYGDPEVTHFLGGRMEESVEAQRAALERVAARYVELGDPHGFWALIEKATGVLVGTLIIKPLPGWSETEIGWHLARRAWGRGFATEAGRAGLDYALNAGGLRRLVAVVHPENIRSLAVARRLGMRHEGRIRVYELDVELFAKERTAAEWITADRPAAEEEEGQA